MKPATLLSAFACRSFVFAAALLLAVGARAQSPATGTIEGRVFDPRRGEYLEKARVTIEGTKLETLKRASIASRAPRRAR